MTVLITVGLVGGGKVLSQSSSNGHRPLTICSSSTSSCATPQAAITTRIAISFTTAGKIKHQQPRPRKVVKPHAEVPAATGAIRVYPTPVPTVVPTVVPTNPPVTTTPPAGQSSVESIIDQVFGSYAPVALQVARCESGLNPSAYNPTSIGGSHAEGVFQILYPSTWMGTSQAASSPYNATANILAAHQIFVRDGYSWHEWSCAA